jgi:prepilin-type N-terminal cleavage/methylation domain-containing protein
MTTMTKNYANLRPARPPNRRWVTTVRLGDGRRSGFTLIELLATIAVIIIILAMAVPVFRVMSGSGSIEGAQNMVSAMLQRARSRAIGMQAPRGVFFFEDQATKRVAMVLVRIDDTAAAPNAAARVIELDDAADELQLLPQNVGAAFMLGQVPGAAVGSSAQSITTYKQFGLIAFDGVGRIMLVPSYTLYANPDAALKTRYPPDGITQLVDRFKTNIGGDPNVATNPIIGTTFGIGRSAAAAKQEFSHTALMLYDQVVYSQQAVSGIPGQLSVAQTLWLDNNGVALAVNRYTGTILKGE